MVHKEIAYYEHEFGDLKVEVIANKWYFSKGVKKDETSLKIFFSKNEDKSSLFIDDVDICYDYFNEAFDLICVAPKSEIGNFSITLDKLAKHLSEKYSVQYENIIQRIKKPDKKMSECHSALERLSIHKGTLALNRELNVNEKKILLLDDTKAGGDTKLLCAKLLIDAGAEDVKSICLGINTQDSLKSN